jgi:hypothetical protein
MAGPSNPQPYKNDIPGLEPAPPRPRPSRHALGLPAGSVRALVALVLLGLLWALAVLYQRGVKPEVPVLFVYLQYVMLLVLASFFAAHGNTIGAAYVGGRNPLGLPRGSVRVILFLGMVGLAVWLYLNHYDFEEERKIPVYLPLILLGGFFLGHLISLMVRTVSGNGPLPPWYQDIQAWFALVAALLLVVIFLVEFINLTLPAEMKLNSPLLAAVLGAVVGFYFGARS